MSPKYDMLSAITAKPSNLNLLVGIFRMWKVTDLNTSKIPFSIELVLIDREGNKIQATIRKPMIYKFESLLNEGVVYNISNLDVAANSGSYRSTGHKFKLNFLFGTRVTVVKNVNLDFDVFNFTPPADCFKSNFDSDYLIDIIGVLTGIGKERKYERNGVKTKVVTMELDNDGYRFQVTLFGSYADELMSFMSSGEATNAVIAVLFVKCKTFNGSPSLQNSIKASKILFNPGCPVAAELKKRFSENPESPNLKVSQIQEFSPKVQIDEDLLKLTNNIAIDALKGHKEEAHFVVLCKVDSIVDEENWWYTACHCNKKVYPDSGMYYCEKCNRHVVNVMQRYRLQLRVIDHTSSATFVLFDREANSILNKTCAELIEGMNLDPERPSIPSEIAGLIDRTFLFKIECPRENGCRYERSYRVKRVCSDPVIIDKFKLQYNYENGQEASEAGVVEGDMVVEVSKDLCADFVTNDTDAPDANTATDVVDLSADANETLQLPNPVHLPRLKHQ